MDRRVFLNKGLAAGAAVAGIGSQGLAAENRKIRILGISCSGRKGKTTATSLSVVLNEAASVDPSIETELIELAGMKIAGYPGPSDSGDDFDSIVNKLKDPALGGLIIGSPTYFRSMSSLCKAFLERCIVLRSPKYYLADKPFGALCVGSSRNGGQELVINQIQTAMLCHEVMVVGGKPPAHQGATLWNAYKDDIMKDEFGISSAKKLGIRIAEAALKIN